MKKTMPLTVLFVLFVLISKAYCHPPYDIKITFDSGTKMLRAVILHNVANPLTHYIKKVDIGLNGMEIIEQSISKQDNNDSQAVSYLIPDAKPGDVLSVEAYCSITGKLKKKITL